MNSFEELESGRSDYGSQFEILVALLYHTFVGPGDGVVDGGANTGLHATSIAPLIPHGHLFCFEPNPSIVPNLARNLASVGALGRCSIHAQALGRSPGKAAFLIDEARPALSHLRFESETNLRPIQVDVVALDQVIGERNVSFVKLDLEGADFRALQGAEAIIRRDHPLLVFENSRAWAARCFGYSQQEFFRFFKQINYDVYDLHGTALTPARWNAPNVAFEFVAGPTKSARLREALELVRRFWRTIDSRPPLKTWPECTRIVREPIAYLEQYHWDTSS